MSTEPQKTKPQFTDYPVNLFRDESRDHANEWDGNALRAQARPDECVQMPTPPHTLSAARE